VEETEYLGRLLSFKNTHRVEVESRIAKAWRKFMSLKSALCSKHYPLKQRMKLFESTVTAVVLYGSCTWTMTADLEKRLRSTQRRMLRWIIGVGRKTAQHNQVGRCSSENSSSSTTSAEDEPPDEEIGEDEQGGETWVEWVQRATRIAEGHLLKANMEEWTANQRRRLFKWAGHAARREDGRWSCRILDWAPLEGKRNIGHPRKRWGDSINAFFMSEYGMSAGGWLAVAQCRDTWRELEGIFTAAG
jgi:hypothetical protein